MKDCGNFVRGKWQSAGGASREVISPFTGALIGRLKESTAADVADAVEGAKKAGQAWAATPIKERTQVLFKFREILHRDLGSSDSISRGISLESGKTLAEARAGLLKGIEVLEFALSLQNLEQGGRMEVSRGVHCEVRREPVGVVAGITPFNFPAMVPMWMMPIAITLGNAFVWKPSDKTPLTSLPIAEAFKEAGLPDGVLTVVQGGKTTVEAILDHPGISAVGFVGSTPVARAVYQRGCATGKRVLALGGAKNHIILLPDADPEMAGRGITDSFTGCAGQRCMAASVVVAVGDCDPGLESVIESIVAKSRAIRLGTDMGAIITRESREKLARAVDKAQAQGARVLLDGRQAASPEGYEGGNWLAPTILDQVSPGSEAASDELFGPVLSVIRAKNLSEAIELANSGFYGNATSVFTSSGAAADRVARESRAGMIGVNIGVPVPREPFSFGGTRESKFGHGDITGPSSLELWTSLKKVTTKWVQGTDRNWMS